MLKVFHTLKISTFVGFYVHSEYNQEVLDISRGLKRKADGGKVCT